MGSKMFYLSDDNLENLKKVENMSKLVNLLLTEYFETNKPIMEKIAEAERRAKQAEEDIKKAKQEQEARKKNVEKNENEGLQRLVVYEQKLSDADFLKYQEMLIKGEVVNISDFKQKFNLK